MSLIENASRRGFLKGMVSAGAFVLSVRMCPQALWGAAPGTSDPLTQAAFQPNVYLAIETDGTVTIIAHRSEMGTGSRPSLRLCATRSLQRPGSVSANCRSRGQS